MKNSLSIAAQFKVDFNSAVKLLLDGVSDKKHKITIESTPEDIVKFCDNIIKLRKKSKLAIPNIEVDYKYRYDLMVLWGYKKISELSPSDVLLDIQKQYQYELKHSKATITNNKNKI